MRVNDESFGILLRRADELEKGAREYLATLAALDDAIGGYQGPNEKAPFTDEEANTVHLKIIDALSALGEVRE